MGSSSVFAWWVAGLTLVSLVLTVFAVVAVRVARRRVGGVWLSGGLVGGAVLGWALVVAAFVPYGGTPVDSGPCQSWWYSMGGTGGPCQAAAESATWPAIAVAVGLGLGGGLLTAARLVASHRRETSGAPSTSRGDQ